MKTPLIKPILAGMLSLGVIAVLPSCVETSTGLHGSRPHYSSGSGRVVKTLPRGYREEQYDGVRYYHHSGTYYRQGSGGYMVVDAPRSRSGSPHRGNSGPDRRDDDRRGDRYDNDRGRNDSKPGSGNWQSRDDNRR